MRKMRSKSSTLVDRPKRYNWLSFVHCTEVPRLGSCWLCGSRSAVDGLCEGCTQDLPWRNMPWRKKLAHIDEVVACFNFAYPIRQLIHQVKFGRDIACARLLGRLAAGQFEHIDLHLDSAALYPVPLAHGRMLRRGFNQAVELCLPVRRHLYLPIDVVSVYKPRAGRAQSRLDAATRRKNIRGAFALHHPVNVDVAIIFDDVITTGATVSAMAQTLRLGGAKRVVVWVIAAA
jgi:ComF family protein